MWNFIVLFVFILLVKWVIILCDGWIFLGYSDGIIFFFKEYNKYVVFLWCCSVNESFWEDIVYEWLIENMEIIEIKNDWVKYID